MKELEEFVNRELELKKTLPFGQWLRHIKDSHEQLCRMVRAGQRMDRPLRVEVLDRRDGPGVTISVYKLPPNCHRILVDVQQVHGAVWGFRITDDPRNDEQVSGKLVSRTTGELIG